MTITPGTWAHALANCFAEAGKPVASAEGRAWAPRLLAQLRDQLAYEELERRPIGGSLGTTDALRFRLNAPGDESAWEGWTEVPRLTEHAIAGAGVHGEAPQRSTTALGSPGGTQVPGDDLEATEARLWAEGRDDGD